MKKPALLGGSPALAEATYIARPLVPDVDEFAAVVREIFASRLLTNGGPRLVQFEAELQARLQARHCLVFANGTLALQLLIKALELSGEVITTPFTFPATVHALHWNQITPVFCDIDPATFNLDPAAAAALVSPRTTGLAPVHVFGNPCDVEALQALAERRGLRLCYDAAHVFDAAIDGRPLAAFGDGSAYSFHATKLFNTMEGGAAVVADDRLAERLRMFRNFGIQDEETVIGPGINAKMNELQAAFGSLTLKMVKGEIAGRRVVAAAYDAALADTPGLRLPRAAARLTPNYQYYPILIEPTEFGLTRDQVQQALRAENVVARKYFYPLCSEFECYRHLPSAAPELLPNAMMVSRRVLCLPIYGELGAGQAAAIAEAIAELQRCAPAVRARL